jgi:hypothetical protein
MNGKVEEMAGLRKEQQRRLHDLQGRVIRLETVLELALLRQNGSHRRRLVTTAQLVSPTPTVLSASVALPLDPQGVPARTGHALYADLTYNWNHARVGHG